MRRTAWFGALTIFAVFLAAPSADAVAKDPQGSERTT